ncbi:MAG: riboflavin synthase [Phycisphaerae bacterium]
MFTGIVRHVGKVLRTASTAEGRRLTIDLGPLREGLALGDSVAVCGACLTACGMQGAGVCFDVMSETLQRTRLGELSAGSAVNLERALTLADALDGHLVQGHVDGMAEVRRLDKTPGRWVIELAVDPSLAAQMVPKGSVAVDGVSLTVVDVLRDGFTVSLIPTTLEETTLMDLEPGDRVNIELDVIGKYVQRYLAAMLGGKATGTGEPGGITLETLRNAGYL